MTTTMRHRPSRRPGRRAATSLLGLAAAAVAVTPGVATAELPTQDRHVLSTGHVDAVGVHLDGGALSVRLHDDTVDPAVVRDPGDVLLHAKPESEMTVPEGIPPIYNDVLGPAGSKAWLLPQVQDQNLLWPGWSSEEVPASAVEGGTFTWRLLSVDGPGAFALYEEGAFGLSPAGVRFNSRDGLPDTTTMNANTHAHFSWAFGARGLYRLRFEVSATPVGGSAVSSGPVEYRVWVGDLADLPDDPVEPVIPQLTVSGVKHHYHSGDTVSLSAVQTPDTGEHHYHWFARCTGAGAFAEVGGGATHSFVVEPRHDGCQYKVTLYGHDHSELVTSEPVTIHVDDHGHEPEPPVDQRPPVEQPPVDGGIPTPTPPVTPPAVTPLPPVVPAPAPVPPTRTPAAGGSAPRVTLGAARLDGRRLTLRLRVDRRARVTVRVRSGRRVVAGGRARTVVAKDGTLRLRLGRALKPGRYRVQVTVRAANGRAVTKTVPLRVRAR